MRKAVLGLDQGTTRTKALVFDEAGRPLGAASADVPLTFPRPGWVETDAEALLQSVVETGRAVLQEAGAMPAVLGLANQGETVVVWDRSSGAPLHRAISWQDRRTEPLCEVLRASDAEELIRARTGLPLDPYFSATKLRWLLDNVSDARSLAEHGHLLAGTTDAFFLFRLTGRHLTDHSTASRTMLYNPRLRDWDDVILRLLDIPRSILPEIEASNSHFGETDAIIGTPIPITGALVDQQAALFGQACYARGDVKVTYGTGAFILVNAGKEVPGSEHGLVPTVAWALGDEITYALDGGIYVAGAAVQWLRDGLGIIRDAAETSELAASVPDTGGVIFVPALAGLAAPYWDSRARGTILGITRGTNRAHLIRATLEAIAFRTRDVLDAMARDMGASVRTVKVDGGASANPFLMQRLADVLGAEVRVAAVQETTALGAAFMAGIGAGVWAGTEETAALRREGPVYQPSGPRDEPLYARWRKAVERSRNWALDEDDLET